MDDEKYMLVRNGGRLYDRYLCVWCPHKGVPLEQLHEGYLSLQQSKSHPNAVARTKTKW